VEEGQFTRIDREEVIRKLREAVPADYTRRFELANRLMPALRRAIARHFHSWYEELERAEPNPYYLMNNRC